MHQSGHCRAQSMHTVQFSSFSAITPRARVGGSSRSCGYCTVTVGFVIVLNVTPRPVSIPLISRFMPSSLRLRPSALDRPCDRGTAVRASGSAPDYPLEGHLQHTGHEDVEQGDRDQPLPRERLELILAQAG